MNPNANNSDKNTSDRNSSQSLKTDISSNVNMSRDSRMNENSPNEITATNSIPNKHVNQFQSALNNDHKPSIPKRKSSSKADEMSVNMKKSYSLENQIETTENNLMCKSKSSITHLNLSHTNSTKSVLDTSQLNQIQEKNNGFLTCERKITPCRQALRRAVHNLYRIDDFHMEKIGAGFFSEVFKVTHKINRKEMVLKLNKHRSNRTNMLKEIQLMKTFDNPNILRLEAACVHEGQLHALTEYASGGNLEQVIEQRDHDLPWSVRMSLALDIAKGLSYLHAMGWFHRDLTSKNILIRLSGEGCSEESKINSDFARCAVIGDFGLATKIPTRSIGQEFRRLQQVGSPYWMSPECLKGEFYDEKADLFSYGIILCELIGRTGADPDVLPRTSNFGVDYIAFSAICPECPPDFIQLSFNCVRIDPNSRPSANELILPLETLLDTQKRLERRKYLFPNKPIAPHLDTKITLKKVGHRRTVSDVSFPYHEKPMKTSLVLSHDGIENGNGDKLKSSSHPNENNIMNTSVKKNIRQKYSSPSEKARFHLHNVMSIGKEMSEKDPYYRPCQNTHDKNPFLALPLFQNGQKIFESEDKLPDNQSVDQFLFSSCFELNQNANNEHQTTCKPIEVSSKSEKEVPYENNNSFDMNMILSNKRHSLQSETIEVANNDFNPLCKGLLTTPLEESENERNSLELNNCTRYNEPSDPIISKDTTEEDRQKRTITADNINRYFEDQMFQGRVQLLRRLYGGGCWVTQDDSAIELSSLSSSTASSAAPSIFNLSPETISCLKRRGSCESGFFSSGFGRNCSALSSRYTRTISSNASGGGGIDDWCSIGMMSSSARSVGSSLLTVSDLEEDLRAASIFLSSKRTSSVFTDDSIDDFSLADFETWDQKFSRSTSTPQGSNANIMEASGSMSRYSNHGPGTTLPAQENRCYEKDIRDIVNYFNSITLNPEANICNRLTHASNRTSRQRELDMLFGRKFPNGGTLYKSPNNSTQVYHQNDSSQSGTLHSIYSQKSGLPRSHKIESLIKRVAEKESRQRYRKTFGAPTPLSASMFQQHQQRLQVCDGIVRSKLQLFDHTKRPQRSRLVDSQKPGHVKAKLAIFDAKCSSNSTKIGHSSKNVDRLKINTVDIENDCHSNDNRSLQQLFDGKSKPREENSSDSTETLNA